MFSSPGVKYLETRLGDGWVGFVATARSPRGLKSLDSVPFPSLHQNLNPSPTLASLRIKHSKMTNINVRLPSAGGVG